MKVVAISDTHTKLGMIYDDLLQYKGYDLLIHAGDGANHKTPAINAHELLDVADLLASLHGYVFDHIIYVPGNHDTSLEAGLVLKKQFGPTDVLIHEGLVFTNSKNETVRIFGSPYTPTFGQDWAYNVKRTKIDKHWQQIPNDTDILVTHGPPKGILDATAPRHSRYLEQVGCKSLLNHVHRVQPKYHIFGHIHDEPGVFNYGMRELWGTAFINAALLDLDYNVINKPITFEI